MSRLQCPSQILRVALRPNTSLQHSKAFSQTCHHRDDSPPTRPSPPKSSIFAPTPTAALPDSAGYQPTTPPPPTSGPSPLPRTSNWHAALADRVATPMPQIAAIVQEAAGRSGDSDRSPSSQLYAAKDEHREPFHLHVYAHRHNTHVALTRPNRDSIISVSCGNLGFKKSKRKHYDAAYQLTQHVLQLIEKQQLLEHIHGVEVILRGFGQGREAAAKVLLSSEGAKFKEKIVRVSDATRIKFGGTRSKNPRRI